MKLAVFLLLLASLTLSPPAPIHTADIPPILRQNLTHRLASPNLALTLTAAGALLILLECNLPGAILPGSLGLLLLLCGAFGLSLHPLRPAALLLLFLSSALLALAARIPPAGALGTAGLVLGLDTLTPAISTSVAIAVGLTLGVATSFLARIAWKAHRNKALLPAHPNPHPTAPKSRLNT